MKISFDAEKREKTIQERGLDFVRAGEVFAGISFTQTDNRFPYGEIRFQTYGLFEGKVVMVVWTQRGEARHIISMRKCNAREKKKFASIMGGSR